MNDDRPNQKTGATATLEKIRPELNLEKWSVWQLAKSPIKKEPRTLKREVVLENGDKLTSEVEVLSVQKYGYITTEDQKTYYGLLKIWEENSRSNSYTYFSLQGLAKTLGRKWGGVTLKTLKESLRRIYATSFSWSNAYYDSATGKVRKSLEMFRILDNLKIVETEADGHVTKSEGYFKFNDLILSNIKNNYTKPVFFKVVINFKSEIAQLLYTRLDLVLNGKTAYERCTKELFDDLCIQGQEYKYKSARKRILEKALTELHNAPLSSGGVITSATIEETKDKKDYKIVIRRNRTSLVKVASSFTDHPIPSRNTPDGRGVADELGAHSDVMTQPAPSPTAEHSDALELLQHFNTVFFKTATSNYTSATHRAHAANLVARYGLDVCRYIIDFAHRDAEKTNFKPRTFGGVLQYVDRAVADYDLIRKQQKEEAARTAAADNHHRLEIEYEKYKTTQLKQYVETTYTADQYAELIEIKKQTIRATHPSASRWSDDALLVTARAGVHRDLFAQIPNFLSFEDFCRQQEKREEEETQETPHTSPAPILLLLQPASIQGEIEAKPILPTPPPPFEA